jgi:UDP-glucose 4-epimerase
MDYRFTSRPDTAFSDVRPTALVWGGLGFIGHQLTRRLLEEGFKVSVLCRARARYAVPDWADYVDWYELENDDCARVLSKAVSSSSVIFNLAGSSGAVASNQNPIASLDNNCKIQLEFLQACDLAGHKPHVIFSSSRLVYGETQGARVDENHPTAPLSIYAVHKLCIENYLQTYSRLNKISHTICRISNAYGHDPSPAGQGYKIINSFITRSLAQLPIVLFGTGEQIRDLIYIDDLIEMLVRCAIYEAAKNQTFNVGSGVGHSMFHAADIIRQVTSGPPIRFQSWPPNYLAVEAGHYVSDIAKSQKLLEFSPKFDLYDGIQATINKYQLQEPILEDPKLDEAAAAISIGN